jgi:phosphate transport system substrate-binding protein
MRAQVHNSRPFVCVLAIVVAVVLAPPAAWANHARTPSSAATLQQPRTGVMIDGSSTVYPISRAMASEFRETIVSMGRDVSVTVSFAGTGGGFRRFCAGETDISNASRPISRTEIDACAAAGIRFVELPIAIDGLSVVVHPSNSFVDSLKVSELRRMWEPAAQGTITRWSQIRPEWPDRPFRLFGPGGDSGTFDYFTDAINGRERASRSDYLGSEDDDVLVQAVAADPDGLAYFGYAHYAANATKLKIVPVDAEQGRGPILPAVDTILDGLYAPLARPLFIYVNVVELDRREVHEFVRFSLNADEANEIIRTVGYLPLPTLYYQLGRERLDARQVGTVFRGQQAHGMKLEELFATTPE